jgi:hypothetical protein
MALSKRVMLWVWEIEDWVSPSGKVENGLSASLALSRQRA